MPNSLPEVSALIDLTKAFAPVAPFPKLIPNSDKLEPEDIAIIFQLDDTQKAHLNRHIGPQSTYTYKNDLHEALSQLGHGLKSEKLTAAQKDEIRSTIKSGLPTCTEGLFDRANMSLNQLTKPATIDQLLADLRKNILVNTYEKFLYDRAQRGEGNAGQEVHVAQSFFRVARDMGLGIPEQFISPQTHVGDVHDTIINLVISNAFTREYTPARIVEALFESVFAELGYYGVNHDETGYAAKTYVAFVDFFANALGIKITAENTDTLYANFMEWQKPEKSDGEDEEDEDSKIARQINKKYVISETVKHLFKIGFFIKDPLTTTISFCDSEASADSAAPTNTLELSFNPNDPMTFLFKLNKGDQTDLFFVANAKHFKSDLNTIKSLEKNILSSTLSRSQKNDLIPLLYLQGINISATQAWEPLLRRAYNGKLILSMMLDHRKGLAKQFTAEMLSAKLTTDAGEDENLSPLYLLAKTTDGIAILKKLLDSNKALANQFTAEMLSAKLTTGAGKDENSSPLWLLASTPNGIKVLKKLLDSNDNLASQITAEMLSAKLAEKALEYENVSPLFFLASCTDGRAALNQLLDINTELAKQFTAEMLTAKITEKARTYENLSPLYFLAKTTDGIAILKKLLDSNDNLASQITAEMLSAKLTEKAGRNENFSPLFFLASCTDGRAALNQLLDINTELANQFTAEMLSAKLTAKAGKYENLSPLYFLAKTTDGIAILKKLLGTNTALAEQFTVEVLTTLLGATICNELLGSAPAVTGTASVGKVGGGADASGGAGSQSVGGLFKPPVKRKNPTPDSEPPDKKPDGPKS